MLSDKNVVATIAVRDMDAARAFYEDKLGLNGDDSMAPEVMTYTTGDSSLFVYKSDYAGGYGATVATWLVGNDLEKIVKSLQGKGVAFEHYDMPDTIRNGDIHVSGDMKMAWLKDPDGNILALVSG